MPWRAISPNGSLDMTFGDDGLVITDVRERCHKSTPSALQPDGKIVVAGQAHDPLTGHSDFALARYHLNGSLDTTFGERWPGDHRLWELQ